MDMSLLDKALRSKHSNNKVLGILTEEHYDVAIAYFNGQITINQVSKAFDINTSSVAHYTGRALREAIKNGYVKIVRKK
jgi:DNA-binding transcriptional regulator LsrR (DeoR family)